jgi:hypothetical protein
LDPQHPLEILWNKLNGVYAWLLYKRRISTDDFLYRRIHPDWQKGPTEISTAAFSNEELSVDLASLTSPEKTLRRGKKPDEGIAKIPVAIMSGLKVPQEVRHSPIILNWAHTLVIGRKPQSVKKQMREKAEIIIHTKSYRSDPDSRPGG